ncbi:MAG: LuxR family transcriptional regulator [Acidobacteria bacterium]|jgi:DNA-binding CsgD family transcriptional regulator|nr:MAG: LuxR family transcriptional regulator [Acidobacteriota bacterium]
MTSNDNELQKTADAISAASPRVGVLLLNSQLRPVHYNAEAASILGYPKKGGEAPTLDAVLPTRFQLADLVKPTAPSVIGFKSGKRQYRCRVFMLDSSQDTNSRLQPRIVVMLEREPRQQVDITQWSDEFQLTSRERETVKLLMRGLTSKEIAQEMNISPNTVKSFLKLVMAKVGVSNRTGLVARVFDKAS